MNLVIWTQLLLFSKHCCWTLPLSSFQPSFLAICSLVSLVPLALSCEREGGGKTGIRAQTQEAGVPSTPQQLMPSPPRRPAAAHLPEAISEQAASGARPLSGGSRNSTRGLTSSPASTPHPSPPTAPFPLILLPATQYCSRSRGCGGGMWGEVRDSFAPTPDAP